MQKEELLQKIRDEQAALPLSFKYLGNAIQKKENTNYNGITYKPDTVHALQTNDEPVGFFPKPISRVIRPVAGMAADTGSPAHEAGAALAEAPAYNIQPNKIFTLFACCIPVQGAARSIICDVQRQHFDFIPNALYQLLTMHKGQPYADIVAQYGSEHEPIIAEYFQFLLTAEYGFWADAEELALFLPLSMAWDSPHLVTNSIIDLDEHSGYDGKAVLAQLDELGCAALQLRCFSPRPLAFFEELLRFSSASRIKTIDLVMAWHGALEEAALVALAERFVRLNNIIVHSAPFADVNNRINSNLSRVIFTTEQVGSEFHCGLVFADYFVVNLPLFTEAQQHNTCLNRKLSVDKAGNIKNCPALQDSFGHVADTPLKAVLDMPGFKDKWHITKDEVAVCKDCEFRYICTDCRANTMDGHIRGKPGHCQYNPYLAIWEADNGKGEPEMDIETSQMQ
jgi:SPASM domain peptide maturase of grasp-with-spasm system